MVDEIPLGINGNVIAFSGYRERLLNTNYVLAYRINYTALSLNEDGKRIDRDFGSRNDTVSKPRSYRYTWTM